jgi:hypothetical protein
MVDFAEMLKRKKAEAEAKKKEEEKVEQPKMAPVQTNQASTTNALKAALARAKGDRHAEQARNGKVVVDTIGETLTDNRPVAQSDPGDSVVPVKADNVSSISKTTNSNITPLPVSAEEFVHSSQPTEISDAAQEQLRQALGTLVQSFENKELVGSAVTYVMQTISANPHLKDNIQPDDIGLMVRGLRMAYGTVIVKKQQGQEKKRVKQESLNEIDELMSGSGFMDMEIKL